MHTLTQLSLTILFLAGQLASPKLSLADIENDLKTILAVDHQATGNVEGQQAYQSLIAQNRSVLPTILQAMNGANPLAANYLRSAFEVIVDQGDGDLPLKELMSFLNDQGNDQKARAMVFEFVKERDPDKADKLLDSMLTDSSAEIRYQAVQKVLDAAKKLAGDEQIKTFQKALMGATDEAQVKEIKAALKKADIEIDLQKHYGLLTNWRIIGPFDNKEMKAFDIAYPPEKEINFSASYKGVEGEVKWQTITTDDEMGTVDIAESIAPYKGAVMYMYSEFISDSDQDVYFRMATANAWKLWVNDQLMFAREEYHRGMRWDQYRVQVPLKKGTNRIFFKILQNEQTQDWAQRYALQMRVCDQSGRGILPVESYKPE